MREILIGLLLLLSLQLFAQNVDGDLVAQSLSGDEKKGEASVPDGELKSPVNVLTTRQQAVHVLSRLSFGPKPGQIAELEKLGWRQWVEQQLRPGKIDDQAMEARIQSEFPSLKMSLAECYSTYWPQPPRNFGEISREERQAFNQKRNRLSVKVIRELQASVLVRAAFSERQLYEVMVDFWRNHFNIDQNKGDCRYFANHYEEQVIRRHSFGNFTDMLLASAHHPAMLIYLDNDVSQKPLTKDEQKVLEEARKLRRQNPSVRLSAFAQRIERHSGLNENYARELMELHTLGVDRYYTQKDVRELARTLTGWTHGWAGESYQSAYEFRFRSDVHDGRSKKLLGVRFGGKAGLKEGRKAVKMLAAHPGTGLYISEKLCRYLLNDVPPKSLVLKAAKVFKKTKGNLPKLYRAILFSEEFMAAAHYRAKFKSPFEFVVSAIRATDANITNTRDTLVRLDRMGQPIYGCEDPTGYFDQTEAWLDPGILVHRWDFSLRFAAGKIKGLHIPKSTWTALQEVASQGLSGAVNWVLPEAPPPADRAHLERVLSSAKNIRRGLGLLLGAPQFQQQ